MRINWELVAQIGMSGPIVFLLIPTWVAMVYITIQLWRWARRELAWLDRACYDLRNWWRGGK